MTTKKETNDNMELWNKVCETDPAITKQVNQRGGFTAVCAQAQIKRATEIWGPYGGKWGVRDLQWGSVSDKDGEVIEMALSGKFFYPDDNEFEIGSDIAYRAGGDSRKKLLTDITTKALSKLGFNADVFEGKFDDNKYVQEMIKKHSNNNLPEPPLPPPEPPPDSPPPSQDPPKRQFWLALLARIKECGMEPEYLLSDAGRKIAPILIKRIARLADPLEGPYENMKDTDEKWLKLIVAVKDFNVKAEIPLAVLEAEPADNDVPF